LQAALLDDAKVEQRTAAQQAVLKALCRAEDLAG
jgi:hypothetical protein